METIFHFFFPLLILLAIFPKLDRRTVWMLSPLAVIPDIDFYMGHRYMLHNIFFVLFVSALVYMLFSSKRLKKLSTGRTAFLIAFFLLSSHLLLDLGGPGVGIIYPVYDKLVSIDFLVLANPASVGAMQHFALTLNPLSTATRSQDAPAITTSGLLILMVFGIPLAAMILAGRLVKKRKRGKTRKRDAENKQAVTAKEEEKEYEYLRNLLSNKTKHK